MLINNPINAQISIGKDSVTNESVLLEFGPGNKGIILPSVESATDAAGGTLLFNTQNKAVMVWEEKDNSEGKWTNLSDENAGIPHTYSNNGSDVIPNPAGAIMGAKSTTKPGVLVLESTTKALVLPQVADPNLTMLSTVAGTIVYDTASKMLAVYDGANWNYWR